MATLPAGVILQQIDGGPTYYASNGFTNAVNMGWDNPSFFPIGPWESSYSSQTDVNTWSALGWNVAFIDGGLSLSLTASNGISVIEQDPSKVPQSPLNIVGLLTADEPSTFAAGVSTPLSTTSNSNQDGLFWWMNDTWSWDWGQGLSGAPGSGTPASILADLVTTPDGTQRHIDINSADIYWFAGSRDPSWSPYLDVAGEYIYGLSSHMTADQEQRGSNYGDMVDIIRSYQAANHPAPIFVFIEDGDPFTGDTNGSDYIKPAEMNWATWSSLIHGARGVIYFDHSFSGPGTADVNVEQSYYQTVQPGQTISIYGQIQSTDALIHQLAPVLNSPYAVNYVSTTQGGYNFGQPNSFSLSGGIETMAKDDNGQFYIFADTRDLESQTNISATFVLNDPNATSVTVVGENRTIPVVNGKFTDTFATAATVHIYEVNDGSSTQPPPPNAPIISSFSPNTNGVDTTNSIKLTGTAADGTVTVLDGTTTVGTVPVTNGTWTITENNAANGVHTFTATDTDANGTSQASLAFTVTVNVPPPPSTNLVVNGGFETGNFTGWTIGPYEPGQTIITTNSHSGMYAAALSPASALGSLSQTLATTPGQQYTLDLWLANMSSGPDDFMIKWNGVAVAPEIVNEKAQGYTEYKFDLVATGAATVLEFDYRQDPTQWRLDDVSVIPGAATQGLAVIGTTGNNTLTNLPGTTSDLFTGNGGIDKFVFHGAAFGNDTITDFTTGSSHDVIQFDHTVLASFAAVKAHAVQVGANTVITIDNSDSVTLLGVSLSHLKAADFHFV